MSDLEYNSKTGEYEPSEFSPIGGGIGINDGKNRQRFKTAWGEKVHWLNNLNPAEEQMFADWEKRLSNQNNENENN